MADLERRIREQARRIHESGSLGKSDTYRNLLDYLVETSVQGRSPKEFEIAMDVFGKDESFDVSRDALVRVYIHKLRQKLDAHYAQPEHGGEPRLEIPRGRYQIVVRDGDGDDEPQVPEEDAEDTAPAPRRPLRVRGPAATLAAGIGLAVIGLALAAVGLASLWLAPRDAAPGGAASPAAAAEGFLWADLLADDHPVELVLGEYFLFSVLNEDFEVISDVRDFGFNSAEDFSLYLRENPQLRDTLRSSSTSYVPRSAAEGLHALQPLLLAAGKEVSVVRVSSHVDEGPGARAAHTIFIGPFASMAEYRAYAFDGSNFTLHPSTELLVDRESGDIYLREGTLDRPFGERYVDYALLSRRTRENGTVELVFSAVGDAAVSRLVEALLSPGELTRLERSLRSQGGDPRRDDLEALYEISGMSSGTLGTHLQYAGPREPLRTPRRELGLR